MGFNRTIFLNRLLSRSTTRAPKEFLPPTHSATELFSLLEPVVQKGQLIETLGQGDEDDLELQFRTKDFLRLSNLSFHEEGKFKYANCLIEFVDQHVRGIAMMNVQTFSPKELNGEEFDRGVTSAHMVVRMPLDSTSYDDGSYRCTIEQSSISRKDIEYLICKRLRKIAEAEQWSFTVSVQKKRRLEEKSYRYKPRVDLVLDAGRALSEAVKQSDFSKIVLTKRSEKLSSANQTVLKHEELVGDLEIKITSAQAPKDLEERAGWINDIKTSFALRGFETKIYYRHAHAGRVLEGDRAVEGAMDLLMCPKENIEVLSDPRKSRSTTDAEVLLKMRELLNRDELWHHAR